MELNKKRMMKLAGILNESTNRQFINEVSTSDLNSTIRYFNDIKKQMTITCDKTIAALKRRDADPEEVTSVFSSPALKLTNIDSSFEDWFEYCVNGSIHDSDPTPIFSEENFSPKRIKTIIKYFEYIKKYIVSSSDKAIAELQKVKSLGKRATDDDIDVVESAWNKDAAKLWRMDSSFERWYDWCLNEIFPSLRSED
jgi:hypothetical protein